MGRLGPAFRRWYLSEAGYRRPGGTWRLPIEGFGEGIKRIRFPVPAAPLA